MARDPNHAAKIGVVADTHGHAGNTRRAVDLLVSSNVDFVIHCGDIGGEHIPLLFDRWPTHFVFGNVDCRKPEMQRAVEQAGHVWHGSFGQIEVASTAIAFLHGDDSRRLADETASGRWRLVCYGHTHRAERRLVGETLVINPGAVYRANPHTIAVVELPALHVRWLEF